MFSSSRGQFCSRKCASREECPADASLKTEELSAAFSCGPTEFLTKICCLLLLGFRCADPNARSFYTYLLHSDLSHTVTAHALTWISDSLLALSDPPMPLVFLAQSSLTEQLNLKIIGLSSSLTAGEVAVSVCRGGCLSSGFFFFQLKGQPC